MHFFRSSSENIFCEFFAFVCARFRRPARVNCREAGEADLIRQIFVPADERPSAMSAPAAKRAKFTKAETIRMLDAAVRAAERSAERVRFTGHELEGHVLGRQIEQMQTDGAIETTDEYDLITQRLNEISKEKAQKKTFDARLTHETLLVDLFADETKKTNVFDCGVCLSEKPLSRMRLVMPCAHAFCAGCIAMLKETNRTRDPGQDEKGCPKCRGPIASAFKPYF